MLSIRASLAHLLGGRPCLDEPEHVKLLWACGSSTSLCNDLINNRWKRLRGHPKGVVGRGALRAFTDNSEVLHLLGLERRPCPCVKLGNRWSDCIALLDEKVARAAVLILGRDHIPLLEHLLEMVGVDSRVFIKRLLSVSGRSVEL